MSTPTEHPVQVSGSATATVGCRDDQTLLDAFLRNGVYLPNSCNQGTCGTCKVRLTAGDVAAPPVSETVLGADDQARGYVLACQTRPCSPTQIEVDAPEVAAPQHVLRDLQGRVGEIRSVADDTVAVHVELDEPLDFSAGQYMELRIPHCGEMRQYSMANPPASSTRLEFHIRRVPSGAATDRWIFADLTAGDEVALRGPWGDFTYAECTSPLLLLAGGTGLAPLKSIALQALADNPDREIHLYHGVRHESDLYDVEFWTELARAHPGVSYIRCLSRSDGGDRHGYVGDAVAEDFASLRGFTAYLCGPPAMVDAGVKVCKRRRMSARNIHRERFTAAVTDTPAVLSA
ncbi:2Fe-2S iron-sulfur cluster binding domain-containing protein [Gordonia desulfuricans]|uniref:2Fe-2S iron-sulfur cluster binding domain-containing protein n=1 Tax=Gordonia desulfuricans TaxID=89051 RepID=A0A7K3LIG8_9ACTN|nr:2Fe-2S iron-sulfur cluster-binding protein [Gordonia desulfuricans]NDK88000.1 2Fe-2S iron-sulfur cluster binding domain-containing protein [Gordonia desulfuricans]